MIVKYVKIENSNYKLKLILNNEMNQNFFFFNKNL